MKAKKYKLKPSRGQLKAMRKAWKDMQDFEGIFYQALGLIENNLAFKTGISDIEFVKDSMMGGEWIGIGNISRTMPLYQREQLEPKES